MHDLASRARVEHFVRDFYRQVAMDDQLGAVFARAHVDWSAHIPKLVDFWAWQLLGEPRYEGNPLRAHEPEMGGGTSLDNSLRFGRLVDTEWILLDMDPWFATGGYLHGAARVWAENGTLLGVASQTSSAIVWEGETPPWLEANR